MLSAGLLGVLGAEGAWERACSAIPHRLADDGYRHVVFKQKSRADRHAQIVATISVAAAKVIQAALKAAQAHAKISGGGFHERRWASSRQFRPRSASRTDPNVVEMMRTTSAASERFQ